MIAALRERPPASSVITWLIVAVVLAAAGLLGFRAAPRWLALSAAGLAALVLLRRPALGLAAVVAAALVTSLEIGTGTEVKLNPATLLIPVLLGIWLLGMLLRRDLRLATARANRPLILFLLAGLLSLGVGTATEQNFS